MDEAEKALNGALAFGAGLLGIVALGGVIDYVTCQAHNWRNVKQGLIYQCILPAVESAFLSALLAKIFGPIPLPLQVAEFVFQNRDLLQSPCHTLFYDPYSGQRYSVCTHPFGGLAVNFA